MMADASVQPEHEDSLSFAQRSGGVRRCMSLCAAEAQKVTEADA